MKKRGSAEELLRQRLSFMVEILDDILAEKDLIEGHFGGTYYQLMRRRTQASAELLGLMDLMDQERSEGERDEKATL